MAKRGPEGRHNYEAPQPVDQLNPKVESIIRLLDKTLGSKGFSIRETDDGSVLAENTGLEVKVVFHGQTVYPKRVELHKNGVGVAIGYDEKLRTTDAIVRIQDRTPGLFHGPTKWFNLKEKNIDDIACQLNFPKNIVGSLIQEGIFSTSRIAREMAIITAKAGNTLIETGFWWPNFYDNLQPLIPSSIGNNIPTIVLPLKTVEYFLMVQRLQSPGSKQPRGRALIVYPSESGHVPTDPFEELGVKSNPEKMERVDAMLGATADNRHIRVNTVYRNNNGDFTPEWLRYPDLYKALTFVLTNTAEALTRV